MLVLSDAFLSVLSVAFFHWDLVALLPWNLVALLPWNLVAHLFDIIALAYRNRMANRFGGCSTFLLSSALNVGNRFGFTILSGSLLAIFIGNQSAKLSRYLDRMAVLLVMCGGKWFLNSITLLTSLIPALLIPNSVAVGNSSKY